MGFLTFVIQFSVKCAHALLMKQAKFLAHQDANLYSIGSSFALLTLLTFALH